MLNPRYVKVHATVIEKTTTSPGLRTFFSDFVNIVFIHFMVSDVAFRGDVSSVLHPTCLLFLSFDAN